MNPASTGFGELEYAGKLGTVDPKVGGMATALAPGTLQRRRHPMPFPPGENPMGTAGFEFIEYAAPDPAAMAAVFERMGFKAIARHRHKDVTLYRQGHINFILNSEPDS